MTYYEECRHALDTLIIRSSNLETEPEQQAFVTQMFQEIHREYDEKKIDRDEYLKLVKRLASYKAGVFNDFLDLLIGAALTGMLDIAIAASTRQPLAQQAREKRPLIELLTGMPQVEPDYDK